MSTLDEITQEKQRVSEALARVDAQREKLASQLGELEATERVLSDPGWFDLAFRAPAGTGPRFRDGCTWRRPRVYDVTRYTRHLK